MKLKTSTRKTRKRTKSTTFDSYDSLQLAQFVNSSNWTNEMISEYYNVSLEFTEDLLDYYKIRELSKIK